MRSSISVKMEMMDTFFFQHALKRHAEEETPSWEFFKTWKERVQACKPKAILIVSAHWVTSHPTVNVVDHNDTIYDFDDFSPYFYKLKYPAPGAPQVAMRVKELLSTSGFETVHEDRTRGLDHAAWFPLRLMYPDAGIPVCELSVQEDMDGRHHYNIGQALAPLRSEGVMIIGSGAAVNNVAAISEDEGPVFSWALEFGTWLKESLLDGRFDEVIHFEKAPHVKMAHPEPSHFYPLLVALGAAENGAKAHLIHDTWDDRCVCFAAYRFSSTSIS
ncbi:hypothetical protein RJ640_001017 [Escallonia rubra]|uniref:Extradiol ring-cleavage dioxygenase class III enzyme subunit B domain-containing protein n=1 Tax=Escallonia rubra TaxID=112253 RepID=A0AA88RJT3_9ASTE|nr:hypothetical protein RJ640_001017 [Escallonia rubra]